MVNPDPRHLAHHAGPCPAETPMRPATKATANLRKHKVSFAHAEQALRDPRALTIEDPDSIDEQRLVTLGMDALG